MVVESEAGARSAGRPRPMRTGRLDHLPTRQRLTGEAAAARSAVVRRLRIALPVLALGLIGALVLNSRSDRGDDPFLDDFADAGAATPEELRMANPRFAGVDDRGNPYEITADLAMQAPESDEVVELVRPRALTGAADEDTLVSAEKGVYRKGANVLDLSDTVTVRRRIGGRIYLLSAPSATVSIRGETVESVEGVVGASDGATLQADRMRAYNADRRVVFEGNVSMRIYPAKVETGGAPPPDARGEAPQ